VDLAIIDEQIEEYMNDKYAGYSFEKWASGAGFGIRDASYDVFMKDGSRFVVDVFYNMQTNKMTNREREYVP